MQGRRGTVGSLPDSLNFDYESPTTNVDLDQQICWNNLRNPSENRLSDYSISGGSSDDIFMGRVSQAGQTLNRWNAGESSSSGSQNLVGHDERSTQIVCSTPVNTSVGVGLRLNETVNSISQPIVNLNLRTNPIVDGPSFMRGSSSGPASHNFDLNEGRFHSVGNYMGGLNSPKPIGFESKLHPSASGSTDHFASTSGNGGLFVEDADGRSGCSMDGRRVSCKRKTLEGNPGESSNEGNFFSRAEGSAWRTIPSHFDTSSSMNLGATTDISSSARFHEDVNPRLGLGMGGRVPVDNMRPLNISDGPESSHRNNRLRTNPVVQPVSVSDNSFSPVPIGVTRHSDVPSVHQPLRLDLMNPIDLMSPIPSETSVPNNQSVATMQRLVVLHRQNTLRPGSSSIFSLSGTREDALPDDSSSRNLPRNIGEHPMFAHPVDANSLASHPTNWNPSTGSIGMPGNTGSSSRSGSHSSGGSSRASHRHPTSQYSRRLSEYVRRSLLSTVGHEIAGQISSNGQHLPVPASSQDGAPSGGGNQGHTHLHSRSALWRERQGDGVGGIPYLRALAAAGEGRSRLVSEIRNALDLIRRGEGLRIEDIMLLDQSVFFGRAEIHDQHRDMRLDVDNMSYEELLALEERIGNVCTGLSEETIVKCLKRRKHLHAIDHNQTEAEPCCVCQEVYRDGEDVGTLDCGHDFHTECIKQWLSQKNLCPICKTTGLSA
ncbi:hypothetical protein RND81_02G053700 [Saponaria officinalis]|uniref:RING-type E3 ubiquitin transferase n=1 Tax=Saponaria officinalis TaxID=3572 RepID=A0AAW1MVN6_SAPOF